MFTPHGAIRNALIVVGNALLIYSIHWLAPHPLVALDMPVSLSPGRILTGDANVSVDTLYYIDIEFDSPTIPTAAAVNRILCSRLSGR